MKTYFKVISKEIGFGKKSHDTGYPGLIITIPQVTLFGGDKFFVEIYGNDKARLQENEKSISFFIDILEFGQHILMGKVVQINEEFFNKKEHICTGWCNCAHD